MKPDPDFHIAASAWLDGNASGADRSILEEICSTEPGHVTEFAGYCHAEAILQHWRHDPASRRKNLEKILSAKPRTSAPRTSRKTRVLAWGGAAAILVLGACLIPSSNHPRVASREHQKAAAAPARQKRDPSGNLLPSPEVQAQALLPRSPEDFELLLKQQYISDFKASGPLPDAAALLVKRLETEAGKVPEVHVADPGDAPVSLHLKASLPAWSLLHMMALQSGTVMDLSGETIRFHRAETPADRSRSLTVSSESKHLKALLEPDHQEPSVGALSDYNKFVRSALGGQISFLATTGNETQYTGPERDIKVVKMAIDAIAHPFIRIFLTFKLTTTRPEAQQLFPDENSGGESVQLLGVFTDPQFQIIMRTISQRKGVDLMTLPSVIISSCETFTISPEILDPLGITAKVSANPEGTNACTLFYEAGIILENPPNINEQTKVWKGTVMIWNGQTLALKGWEYPDGSKSELYVTAVLVDPSGSPTLPPTPRQMEKPLELRTPFPGAN